MQDKKTTGVAIYCRVAHKDVFCIEQQIQTMRCYAKENGYASYEVYADNGFNGLSDDRPALIKLSEDIRVGRIQTILVFDASRLFRDCAMLVDWHEGMDEYDVSISTIYDKDRFWFLSLFR